MERGRPRDQLDILLGGAQLEGQLIRREGAGNIEQQPGGQHGTTGAEHLCVEGNP
jgi:hypothetical protein